jgi:hypothetical protein
LTQAAATAWRVGPSEGLDAVAFLGALSGGSIYVQEYPDETREFAARLPAEAVSDLQSLRSEAEKGGFGLLWPTLANVLSAARTDSLDDIVDSLESLEARILPGYRASPFWKEVAWAWLVDRAPRVRAMLAAMAEAGFQDYWRALALDGLASRAEELKRQLVSFDVVSWLCKLTGLEIRPEIEIALLHFCRPHGVRIQGQRFIQSPDFDLTTTVRIAAHELLHPPIDMNGPVARAALETLGSDLLMQRIVADHNPAFGYTTLDGLLNEDLCQALDQLIVEQLSVARSPADRWLAADEGMHVLAAGIYGMLRADRWTRSGGSIEQWLARATSDGRLDPKVLHPVAARVLERPVDQLWPVLDSAESGVG